MKKEYIQLHFPKYIKSSIIVLIASLFHYILLQYFSEVINPIFIYLISFIGEFLAIILYFIEKKRISIEYHFNLKKKKIIFIFLFICTICDFIGKIDFRVFSYYNHMKKLLLINSIINVVCLFFFIFLVEHKILKIPIYRHHIFGIGLSSFGMIIALIIKFKITIDNIVAFFMVFLFSLTTQYLITLNYVIPKKLNTEYFIEMNLICFIRGFIGIFISIIFFIINFYFSINQYTYNNNEIIGIDYILMVIYCIISFILNVYILKVTEESRPCYILLPQILAQIINNSGITFLFTNIYKLISPINSQNINNSMNKRRKYFFKLNIDKSLFDKIIEIISNLFSFIGVLIFSEVVIVNFCNLDKFTNYSISKRAKCEVILDITQFESDQELETSQN